MPPDENTANLDPYWRDCEALGEALRRYEEKFGEGFPLCAYSPEQWRHVALEAIERGSPVTIPHPLDGLV